MWLVISLVFALAASAAYWRLQPLRERYKLGSLALMLWGTVIMVAVDHAIAFLNGGPFITFSTDGLIGNSSVLGLAMVIPIVMIWAISVYSSMGKRINPKAGEPETAILRSA